MAVKCKVCRDRWANRTGRLCHVCDKTVQAKIPDPVTDERETMLQAMQHVSTKPRTEDRTHQQKEMRKWLEEDRRAFHSKRADLEKAALGPKAGAAEPGEKDEGTERCVGLIDKLLDEATEGLDGR